MGHDMSGTCVQVMFTVCLDLTRSQRRGSFHTHVKLKIAGYKTQVKKGGWADAGDIMIWLLCWKENRMRGCGCGEL